MGKTLTGATLHKTVPAFLVKATDQGVVDAIVSVMGIIDLGGDVIYNGAYTKTIQERMKKIRVLDNHNTDSVRRAIARPIFLKEIPRAQLPAELVAEYPDATGGLLTSSQYMLDDDDSLAVFKRIRDEFINEYSIGFDIITQTFDKVKSPEGKEVVARGLRELRLWEYSPVLWGMNQATTTVGAKSNEQEVITVRTTKGQAPDHYMEGTSADRCASCLFYKTLDKATGHCDKHDFVAAREMTCADHKPGEAMDKGANGPDEVMEYTPDGPQKRLGDYIKGKVYDKYMSLCNSVYTDGYVNDTEHKQMCETGLKLLDTISNGMTPDCAMRPYGMGFELFDLFFAADGGSDVKSQITNGLRASIQTKAGRVLNAHNESLLQQAADLISEVLLSVRKDPPADADDSKGDGAAESPTGGAHDDTAKRLLALELAMLEFELQEG